MVGSCRDTLNLTLSQHTKRNEKPISFHLHGRQLPGRLKLDFEPARVRGDPRPAGGGVHYGGPPEAVDLLHNLVRQGSRHTRVQQRRRGKVNEGLRDTNIYVGIYTFFGRRFCVPLWRLA